MKKLLLILLALAGSSFGQGFTVTGLITNSGSTCTSTTMNATLNGPSNCVSMQLAANISQASIVLAGTFSASVQFELSADNGNTWVSAPTASSTSAGTSNFQVAAYTHLRARASTYSSGGVAVTITLSTAAISGGGGGSFTAAGDLSGTSSSQTVTGIQGNPVASGSATVPGQYFGENPGATAFALLGQPTFDAQAYGLIPDGSTNNATTMAALFTASNAVTLGNPVVHFGCVPGVGCQYNFNAGASVSPFNPTTPTTVVCDPGVTLNVTGGSAHAFDWGPTGLSSSTYVNQEYRMTGCRQTYSGGSSLTHGNFFNQYLPWITLDNNFFYNCPGHASSAVFCVFADGYNWDMNVHDNRFEVDNSTALNQVKVNARDNSSWMRFHDNHMVCVNGVHGTVGCTTSGIGVWVDGTASRVLNNNIAFFTPDVRLGANFNCGAAHYQVGENQFEIGPGTEIVQIGDPAGGNSPSCVVGDVEIAHNYANLLSRVSSRIISATTTNAGFTNSTFGYLQLTGAPASAPFVHYNAVAGQTGNQWAGPVPSVALGASPTNPLDDGGGAQHLSIGSFMGDTGVFADGSLVYYNPHVATPSTDFFLYSDASHATINVPSGSAAGLNFAEGGSSKWKILSGNFVAVGGKGQHFNPQAAASDISGTCSAGSGTTCVITFTTNYTSTPSCAITPTFAATSVYLSAQANSGFTITYAPSGASSFNYVCVGNPN